MAKRLTRKKLKQKDEFITFTEKLVNSAAQYRSYFIMAGIVLVFTIIFGGVGLYYYKDYSNKGSFTYFEALHLYDMALKTQDKKDINNALDTFESIRTGFTHLEISRLAVLYIGNCQYMLGNYNDAIGSYREFLSAWGDKKPAIAAIAYNGEIQSYIAENDCKSALGIINSMLASNDNPMKQLTYIHAVTCYLTLNQPDKAVELLKEGLIKYNNNSDIKEQLTNLLSYVNGKEKVKNAHNKTRKS